MSSGSIMKEKWWRNIEQKSEHMMCTKNHY